MSRRSLANLLVAALVLAPALFVAGLWLGGHPRTLPEPVRDAFVDEDVQSLDDALRIIEADYYREVDRDTLIDDSLAGAVTKLRDRFSAYLSPREFERFQASSQGAFSGVGMEVTQVPKGLRVTRVFPDSPARREGIQPGDVIVAANGTRLAGRTSARSTELIRGRPGTYVTLGIERRGKRRTLRVKRARVEAPSVTSRLRTVD